MTARVVLATVALTAAGACMVAALVFEGVSRVIEGRVTS